MQIMTGFNTVKKTPITCTSMREEGPNSAILTTTNWLLPSQTKSAHFNFNDGP
jgi:hypothetical protein